MPDVRILRLLQDDATKLASDLVHPIVQRHGEKSVSAWFAELRQQTAIRSARRHAARGLFEAKLTFPKRAPRRVGGPDFGPVASCGARRSLRRLSPWPVRCRSTRAPRAVGVAGAYIVRRFRLAKQAPRDLPGLAPRAATCDPVAYIPSPVTDSLSAETANLRLAW